MGRRSPRSVVAIVLAGALLVGVGSDDAAFGANRWDGLHWPGTGTRAPKVVSFLSEDVSPLVKRAMSRWEESGVVDLRFRWKEGVDRPCRFADGVVRLCTRRRVGDREEVAALTRVRSAPDGHILAVVVMIERRWIRDPETLERILCHELGHALGLDERPQKASRRSCMASPTERAEPDGHDLRLLATIHAHRDG